MEYPYLVERSAGDGDLKNWLLHNAGEVDQLLVGPGAVLFRGFEVSGADEFHDLVGIPLGELLQYIEGASPRTPIGGGVYTSTEYSPELAVSMHNELSYSHQWPARLAFYCKTPAPEGGQTPIADSRKVFRRVVSSLTSPPSAVQYLRRLHNGKGPGVDWPTVFNTNDKSWVENYCRNASIRYEWLNDGALRTSQIRPTAIKHPHTGEKVWFNQAHQWHPSNAGEESEAMLRAVFGDELPMNAQLPDGRDFDPATLNDIREAYSAEVVTFDWQAGDVLIIDNMLSAHGRTPFTGHREVFVAMGLPVRLADVDRVNLHG